KSVSVIVSNVKDNSILAMATYPNFDLDDPYAFGEDMDEKKWNSLTDQEKTDYYYGNRWRNIVISNIYEPGSVMKSLITAIALEEGLINENTEFTCHGVRKVADQELKCISYPDGHGTQTVQDAFINSCNVTYMQISELIGRERLYKYLRKLHMFEATGIDLPNEASPFHVRAKDVGPVELATLGYGHAININMMNMVAAVSSLVNGGYYIPPYIATDASKHPLREGALQPERVFSQQTSDTMKKLMESQTSHSLIYNKAVRIGGKSGTTVKIVDGEYDDDTIISSYIAFAPMDNPTYCVYAVIDEPDIEEHGLLTAHKLVKRVFADIFRLYSIDTEVTGRQEILIPDFVGSTLPVAEELAKWNSLEVSTNPAVIDEEDRESYMVIDQYPAAGTLTKEGSVIILNVEKKSKNKKGTE
ncbi:MAG: penicillin-binding transpeptidase domain-containing protein, partial [Bacillota bacterium]|nr:penicillin-binding transpeptidase domain-containing protein [Bacillota bacterium]